MIPAKFFRNLCSLLILALVAAAGPASGSEHVLSFEDRVACQEAIERVYYSHQIGATRPFEEAVSRPVIEKKVRTYLQQSLALQWWWKTSVTALSLEHEIQRIAANTQLPERLFEVYGALGGDSILIQECLARPVLVDRLARSFFATDQRIHGRARREAEGLRARLTSGGLDPLADHPHRNELEVIREDELGGEGRARLGFEDVGRQKNRLALSVSEFERWRRLAPEEVGQIGEVLEERERFVIMVILEEGSGRVRLARYTVLKEPWETWWRPASAELDAESTTTVARPLARFPEAFVEAAGQSKATGDDWSIAPDGELAAPCKIEEAWHNGVLDDPAPDRARYGHTAVWTGSLMIVWGGSDGSYLNLGRRYDPLTDIWTSTTTVGAPPGRMNHTAVWTGTGMVVWGGTGGGFKYFADGGRYDPVSDTWTATQTSNAPQARAGHTAVWSGGVMIVWGGDDETGPLNTGSRYDPVSDTWRPTITVNALKPRSGHTAVWTAGVMVVWGGRGAGVFNTGGRYDPLKDRWTATTTLNAPEARHVHTAVSADNLMVVWGGIAADTSLLDTGGRYDPVTDTWRAVTTTNAPEARYANTAVWTGSVIVVWGGDWRWDSQHRRPIRPGGRHLEPDDEIQRPRGAH